MSPNIIVITDMQCKRVKQLLTELDNLEEQRRQALKELLTSEPLLSGSVSEVSRKCGKPNCYCAKGDNGHVQLQLVYLDNEGARRSRIVHKADVKQIRALADRAKRYREALARLQAIQNQQLGLLNGLKAARSKIYKPKT